MKFEFVSASIHKPSHGMKRNLVGESYTYEVKNVGKGYWNNIRMLRLISFVTRLCMLKKLFGAGFHRNMYSRDTLS